MPTKTRFSQSILIFSVCVLVFSCQTTDPAQSIVDQSIAAHGGKTFESSVISFDFRDRHYQIFKSPTSFEYVREFNDSTGQVRDVLDNLGFTRTINGTKVELPEERIGAFSRSVNSVAYFAFLPYGLNDPAVKKTLFGESALEGNTYDLIRVTFAKDGGGEDFDDVFLYWINQETKRVDFLAYSYHTDGGGVRFRKAVKTHEVGGLVLQDYENYGVESKDIPVEEMENLYKSGKLKLLSTIALENVAVVKK
jgi:hypothetical protein